VKWMGLALGLLVATPLTGQGYGESLAVGDGQVIVGESLNTIAPGYVYVYEKDAGGMWSEVQRLEASNSAAGDHFGRSLALTGNHLLVGSTTMETIYVFERDGSGTWRETQTLRAMGSVEGDYIGRMAAVDGDNVLMAAWAYGESRGAVYVFHRDTNGRWSESAVLTGSDSQSGDLFGMSIAIDGDVVLIGAPEKDGSMGAAYVFRRDDSGTWSETGKLTGNGTSANSRFGRSVALREGRALIGASTHERGLGSVFAYTYNEDSAEWDAGAVLKPFDGGTPGTQFGALAQYTENGVWLGAPGASGFEGRIYSMTRGEDGGWTSARKIAGVGLEGGDIFGGSFAIDGAVAVVGVIGDDFGLGTAAVLERSGTEWTEVAGLFGTPPVALEAITGDGVDCSEGSAFVFGCQNVDMLSFLPVSDLGGGRGVQVNDLWGWTDPESGREYVIVGRYDGTSFVDVSDPSDPHYLGNLPMTEGAQGNTWRDIKVFDDHAFIVADGAGQHGMQVFDLTKLRDVRGEPMTFEQDAIYERIASAHNIVINEDTGFAYAVGVNSGGETCGGGLHMINIQDPLTPLFAGCFQDMSTGNQNTGYSHDAQCINYNGPDEEHRGQEICFGANETALSIADVTDKAAPVALSMASYPNVGYTHQGWIDEEHEYFYMNDETDETGGQVERTRTLVWDIKDLDDPVLVKEYFADNTASDHNLYIRGDLMYQSNYVSGLRIVDISDRENPELVGYFDTVPWSPDAPGFDGSWSNYPYFESGIIVVSSGAEGMFILRKSERNLIP
jgi:choice-of-anchor B domain-containing protein